MTLKEVVEFYSKQFLPVYADLVAYLADKPQQITFEIENTFSHIMVAINENEDSETRNKNILKAHGHLVRATLDSYKMLWTRMSYTIDSFTSNDDLRKYAFNLEDHKILETWNNFKNKAKEAREHEMKYVGKNHLDTIALYKEAIDLGEKLLNSFDQAKADSYKKFSLKNLIKNHGLSLLIGIIAGIIVTFIFQSK